MIFAKTGAIGQPTILSLSLSPSLAYALSRPLGRLRSPFQVLCNVDAEKPGHGFSGRVKHSEMATLFKSRLLAEQEKMSHLNVNYLGSGSPQARGKMQLIVRSAL